METLDIVRLYFREGTSDKVYVVELLEDNDHVGPTSYVVRTSYGRRTGTLVNNPDERFALRTNAWGVFNRYILKKQSKGYSRESTNYNTNMVSTKTTTIPIGRKKEPEPENYENSFRKLKL